MECPRGMLFQISNILSSTDGGRIGVCIGCCFFCSHLTILLRHPNRTQADTFFACNCFDFCFMTWTDTNGSVVSVITGETD